MMTRRVLWCLTLTLVLWAPPGWAQPVSATPPSDPLGRETPRGTVLGLISAAREGKLDIAAQYLETPPRGESATELARQLSTVLNGRLPARLTSLSDRPDGSQANPLVPDREVVGTIPSVNGDVSIVLARVPQRNGSRIWLFSRPTLQWVPDVYREVDLRSIDRYLPGPLSFRLGRVRLFHWLILFAVVPLIYRLFGVVDWIIGYLVARWAGAPRSSAPAGSYVPGSARLLLMALVIYLVVPSIDLPLAERALWALVVGAFTIAGCVGLAFRLVDYGAGYLQQRAQTRRYSEGRALIRLMRGVAQGLVCAVAGVVALRYFGFDPTAALAGLGIGGIAIALAAQKTLENVIGGFSVVFDKAIRVGDVLRVGETMGMVDYVGLRSTRIRTQDRTIVTVPNGQMATVNIETLSARDKFWFRHVVGLSYSTTPEQLRAVTAACEDFLMRHPHVDTSSVRVRLFRMGAYSLDIELFAYVFAPEWDRFMAVQQELLLRVMEIVAAAGTEIAIPSQTLHLTPTSFQPSPR